MKQCKGEELVNCKRCLEIGLTTTACWKACDLYMVDGYEGQYCYQHAKELEEKVVKGKVMDKQKILEEIQKTEEHLTNMKKMLEECQYERWKPKSGEQYFFVDSNGDVVNCLFDPRKTYEIRRCDFYNCFKTLEQAEAEAEKILVRHMLEDIARRLNKGEEIDWDNTCQSKYYLGIKGPFKVIVGDTEYEYKHQGVVYCLDMDFRTVAIQEIGEKRLEKYLTEE